MRVLGYTLLAIFCLVLMAGTFLYVAAPVGFVRDQIVAAVKRETGRDLIIRGKTSFAFYPNLGVALEDVELSPPPGMGGAPLLKTASLKLDMPVLALLQSRVSIEQFVLDKPVINLRVDADGRKSWSFDSVDGGNGKGSAATHGDQPLSPELEEFIQNSNTTEHATSKTGSGLAAFSLGDVRIIDGTFTYSDARDGTSETLTNVNLSVGLDNLASPLSLSGQAEWRGREIPVEASVTNLAALLDNRPSQVTIEVSPENLRLNFSGRVHPGGVTSATGKLKLTMDDVPGIARWIGGESGSAGPLRTIALEGTLQGDKNTIRLGNARFTVNDLAGTANVSYDMTGRKKIAGSITVGDIKTASFLTASQTRPASGQSGAATGANGWSSAAINFKPLRTIDADLTVGFKSIAHNDIRIGAGKLRLALTDGVMRIDANPIAIYGGAARGTVVVNARRSIATYQVSLAAERVSALPLLKAVAGFDWLSGATTTQVNVQGRGLSQRQMIRTMSGTASFNFTNGAIEGMNIAKILRGVQQGRFNNFDRVAGEKTDFSELSASFRIERGVAANNDLRLLGPLVRASGTGSANLGARTIDYRLTPKLVASLEGQGGDDVSGLSIPLKIQGPWAKPRVTPDLESVLQNPESAAAAIDSIGKALGKSSKINSGKVKDLLDGILGGSSGDGKKNSPLGSLFGDFLQQQ